MCGICGVFNYGTGSPVEPGVVRSMTDSMVHRGPDDDGYHFDAELALGMRRLSIIDLEGGAQPIANENGRVHVVMNGEIYNYRELRAELESHGHRFRTNSDTESVVHAFEEWGLAALERLNGMFGVAVWDGSERRLVVARDLFGVKPVYYTFDGKRLIFGSEIRALLAHPGVAREVDEAALLSFLRHTYVPAPRTAFAGILKLEPGHALVADAHGVRVERFDAPDLVPLDVRDERELSALLADEIGHAVRRQTVADVPVGVMLSGGIDSAAVAAIMRGEGPVSTFTVGFEGDFELNELAAARATADALGTDHHELVISEREFESFLPKSVWHLEEPIATSSTLPFFRVSELARQHVKVVLTGQGADEPFAGYPRYLGERYGWVYRLAPMLLRRHVIEPAVELLPRNEQFKRAVRSLGAPDVVERLSRIRTVIDEALLASLVPGSATARANGARDWHADVRGLDALSQMLYVDARTVLPDNLLLYADKLSMAVSLEARVPYLDVELMRLAERIPSRFKIRRFTQKRILKDALARWLPPETIKRKKIGFATPVDAWFRGALGATTAERLLAEGSGCREFLDAATVRRILDEHRSGRHDHKRILFSLLTFELWHEQFIAPRAWRG